MFKSKTLYTKISSYAIISIIIGVLLFFVLRRVGEYVIVSTNIMEGIVTNNLEETASDLTQSIENSNNIYESIEKWSYSNRYYVIYIFGDDGMLYYSNDFDYSTGESELSFPTEKLFDIEVNGTNMQVAITYLAMAEVSAIVSVFALILSTVIAGLIFIFLIKQIIDQIKNISTHLEIIAAGDIQLSIPKYSDDEIGVLVDNLNNMKSSLIELDGKNNELEEERYSRIASMSHDIRTPLTIIQGYIEILKSKQIDKDTTDYLNKIEDKLENLEELTDRLFVKAKSKNKSEIVEDKDLIDYYEFIAIVTKFEANLNQFGFNIEHHYGDDNYSLLNIDKAFLCQILNSIESNIVKYADHKGIIEINTSRCDSYVTFEISNLIASEQLGKCYKGAGEGLKLLQKVLEQYKGHLVYYKMDSSFILSIKIKTIND